MDQKHDRQISGYVTSFPSVMYPVPLPPPPPAPSQCRQGFIVSAGLAELFGRANGAKWRAERGGQGGALETRSSRDSQEVQVEREKAFRLRRYKANFLRPTVAFSPRKSVPSHCVLATVNA